MNTIVAESLDYVATRLEKAVAGDPSKFDAAVQKVLEEIHQGARQHHLQRRRLYGGVARGSRKARPAQPALMRGGASACSVAKEATELFEHYGVLSPRELHSRMEVYIEQYCLSVGLEARTAIEMAKTIIFPAAIRYQGELAATCASLKAVGYTFDTDTLDKITALVKELQDGIAKLEKALGVPTGVRPSSNTRPICAMR